MAQLKQQSSETDWTVEEECDLCRITYSIYSNFPPMPHAQALNAETGEFFPFDRVRKMKSGYAMAEALGYAWACNCRRGSGNYFDQRFRLRDSDGRAVPDTFYTVRYPTGELKHGVTDHAGRTARYRTRDGQQLAVYLGHRKP
ncbi:MULTISPECIES: hypothetical protein [Paraburkholderia]|uniref:Uncharacterized protein n=1 Tax=Paraburkholderia youngii TaxID=2782701 RepID=A0A7W8LDF2_9BURK|nr:hypothetical protein [Paraburkholderia youngii]MBB5404989.1 hypothetical protein [Paraburkholderia youngii]NUX58121.1 hypothetical protein [Paraburkholderia youngii]NVI09562.1 hypothetical protein [Paraburkholderia youngii]